MAWVAGVGGAHDRGQVRVQDQLHVLRDRHGVPGLDHLGALEDRDRAPVHRRLHVLDRWVEPDAFAVELEIDLEGMRALCQN